MEPTSENRFDPDYVAQLLLAAERCRSLPHPGKGPLSYENLSTRVRLNVVQVRSLGCLTRIFLVARISNPLYRRASSLRRARQGRRGRFSTPCRLEIGDTAGWKPALRRFAIESVGMKCEISGLGMRRQWTGEGVWL
jgi:hypothetical protein